MTGIHLVPLTDQEGYLVQGDMTSGEASAGSSEQDEAYFNSADVLSDELRRNFEAVKEARRQVDREKGAEPALLEGLRRKERQQAIETALAVESEVAKWQSGIAELEAMLAATEQEEDRSRFDAEGGQQGLNLDDGFQARPVADIRFPSLPPVVVPDDDDSSQKD